MSSKRDAGPLSMPDELLPRTLLRWYLIERRTDGARYRRLDVLRLTAIFSLAREVDGRRWLHLSVAHERRFPSWEELVDTKRQFVGDRYAYQVFPTEERYVNRHQYCLHLFSCLDVLEGMVLPDFTMGGGW